MQLAATWASHAQACRCSLQHTNDHVLATTRAYNHFPGAVPTRWNSGRHRTPTPTHAQAPEQPSIQAAQHQGCADTWSKTGLPFQPTHQRQSSQRPTAMQQCRPYTRRVQVYSKQRSAVHSVELQPPLSPPSQAHTRRMHNATLAMTSAVPQRGLITNKAVNINPAAVP